MNKTNTRNILALSSGCMLVMLGQVRAQEPMQEEDTGFSFSEDSFSLEPEAQAAPIYDNFVEGGIGYNSEDSYRFGRFNGLTDQGAFVNGGFRYLRRGEWNGDDLTYMEAFGENLGLDSRRLYGEGGVQGKYQLFLNYEEIPYYDYQTRTPYQGVGSGSLTLPSNWISNSNHDFNTATQNFPELGASLHGVDIETERTQYGGGVRWDIDRHWSMRVSGEREKQEGLKPLGVAWGTSGQNAVAVIVPQPVDYRTDRVDAEVGYRDRKLQFRMAYQYSNFNNDDSSLWLQNPFTYAGWPPASYPNGVAQMDLAPDNTAHMFNLSGGYNFTDTTRLTANFGYSRYRQDDALLPYTSNPDLTVYEGVPRSSADAEITNTIANLEFYSRPTEELDYKLRYRYTDRDNDTPQDMYIYVVGDAENQQIGGNEANYRYNTPYSFTEQLFGGDLGYRLQRDTKLSLGYEYRSTDRTYSERAEVDEQVGSIAIRHRLTDGLTGKAEYAHTWRNGSTYDDASTLYNSYTQTYVDSLGDAPFINHPELRMYHLADMTRDEASARLTYAAKDNLIVGGRLTYVQDDYDESTLGLTGVDGWGASLDASYRLNKDLTINGFYAYDDRTSDQAGWSFGGGPGKLAESEDPSRRWWTETDYQVNTFGAGLDWQITPKVSLSADYVYTDAVTKTSSQAANGLDQQDAGSFPDITSRTHSLRSELGYQLSGQTTLGLSYIYESYDESDWQTDNVAPDTLGRVLSLQVNDPSYDNHVILGWARYQF